MLILSTNKPVYERYSFFLPFDISSPPTIPILRKYLLVFRYSGYVALFSFLLSFFVHFVIGGAAIALNRTLLPTLPINLVNSIIEPIFVSTFLMAMVATISCFVHYPMSSLSEDDELQESLNIHVQLQSSAAQQANHYCDIVREQSRALTCWEAAKLIQHILQAERSKHADVIHT